MAPKEVTIPKKDLDSLHSKIDELKNENYEVCAYSDVYGWLPATKLACSGGAWKDVSVRADHYTGKSSEVMNARKLANSKLHDAELIDKSRRTMIRTCNASINGESSL